MPFRVQPAGKQRVDLGFQTGLVVGAEFDQVDGARRLPFLAVFPCTREPSPLASVAIMPPIVARLDGDRLGAK